jgi:hypothetical protein
MAGYFSRKPDCPVADLRFARTLHLVGLVKTVNVSSEEPNQLPTTSNSFHRVV